MRSKHVCVSPSLLMNPSTFAEMDTLLPLLLHLSSVTVYPAGGLYSYSGLLSVEKGLTHLVWADLPPGAHPQSVRVSLPSSAKGYIVQTAVEPLSPTWRGEPSDVVLLRRKIDSLESSISQLQHRLTILQTQESILLENKKLGGEEGPTRSEEVEKYLLLVERQLSRLLAEKAPLQKRIQSWQDTLARWRKIYESRLQGLVQTRAALFITYWSPQKEVVPIRVELSGPQAGWKLRYRIRALPGASKVLIQRWAQVQNFSGEDWRQLPLTLSSAQPGRRGEMPPFHPWYVDIAPPPYPFRSQRYAAPAAPGMVEEMAAKATEDGSEERSEQEEVMAPPLPVIDEQLLSRTYDLGPQTVPAGGRWTQFFLKEDTLDASFQFFINAPTETQAYLRAALPLSGLTLWETAPATVEVEGQEVATLSWPPSFREDTLWLDLGRSEKIYVRRVEILNRQENRLGSSTVHRQFAYTLHVSHSYPTSIRLTVWDRIPVSRNSEIKVELTDSGNATLDPERGQLRWDFTLQPGEVWEKTFRFTVKYPRQKPIIGL
ncbi:MAG: DUF4139 domain-containing protein [Bacteroidia bacterium]|nr:DUF4139 domain-containing protein [Bacteroidia bacterium]